jgi:hypothetical protein
MLVKVAPELEAISIVHIYWTLLQQRKSLASILQCVIAAPLPHPPGPFHRAWPLRRLRLSPKSLRDHGCGET